MKRAFLIALGGVLAAGTGVAVTIGYRRRKREMPPTRPGGFDSGSPYSPLAGSDYSDASANDSDATAAARSASAGRPQGAPATEWMPAQPPTAAGMVEAPLPDLPPIQMNSRNESDEMVDLTNIAVGSRVYDAAGEDAGLFRAMQGGYFELGVPGDADFWLSSTYIGAYRDGAVHLSIGRGEFDQHRLHAPGLEPANEPLDRPIDSVISNEEALAQRERMEHELREQRGQMDTDVQTPLPAQHP